MSRKSSFNAFWLATAVLTLATTKGCHCENKVSVTDEDDTETDPFDTDTDPADDPRDDPEDPNDPTVEECLRLEEIKTTESSTAGVRTVFKLSDCDDMPIADLADDEVGLLLDGESLKSEGDATPLLNHQVDMEQYALVLLDMSDSIVESGNLPGMIAAARRLVNQLLDQGVRVAIYRFAGPKHYQEMEGFTDQEDRLAAALDALEANDGLGTTDLYGSIIRSVDELERAGGDDVITSRTLVVFTDGTDEAMEATNQQALNAVGGTEAQVFTVGLGGDVDKDELLELGKSGFEWAEDTAGLREAFDAVIQQMWALVHSHYLIGVCSPRTNGIRSMTIRVRRGREAGELEVLYNAAGFDIVGCDVEQVAFPCLDSHCGQVDSFACGTCAPRYYCNPDRECVDACEGVECGDEFGVRCGDCSEKGTGFGCDDGVCVPACEEQECGTDLGVDCGDCSGRGDDFGCDDGACVQACLEAECGTHLGVDCGGCEADFTCSAGDCIPNSLPGMSWVPVPGGITTAGCTVTDDPACGLDELPRTANLRDFWIMEREITVDLYARCVTNGRCDPTNLDTGVECNWGSGRSAHPINCITWQGLRDFCHFVGGELPTEAQWERAFRGDHDGELDGYWVYPWGDSPAPSCARVFMSEGGPGCGTTRTAPVASKPSTSYGLFDMAGNVAEWTKDFYGETFDDCGDEGCYEPQGPVEGEDRVVRGGAYDDFYASAFRTAKRNSLTPLTRSPAVGGRCVR